MSPSVHNGVRLDETDDSVPGFTAVNGRSPPQTLKLSVNGSERRHSRAEATPENDRVQDRRPLSQQPDRSDRPLTPRPPERDTRPSSPAKRKRSLYDEDDEADMYSRPAPRMVRQARSSSSSEEEDDEDDEEDDDDDEEEDDDTLDDDENGESSAQTRDFVARSQRHTSSAGVDQYVVVSRREDEAGGTSRKDRAPDGPQPSESANDYSSTPGYTRAGVQVDKSKRKRQFSKRTKTGCGTCRRRKKKCDEAKPTCNNCVRGGFMCEGYFLKTAWQKPGAPNSHPPLQSKFSYAEHPGIFPRPTTETFPNSRQPLSLDEARSRPLLVEDDRTSTHSSSSWPAWGPPQNRMATALRAFPSYSEQNSYPHGQSSSSIVGSSLPQPPHLSSPQPVITAQLAIQQQQHQQHQPSPLPRIPPPLQKSEKEKMLANTFFKPMAPELRAQRHECKVALDIFNRAVGVGAKDNEQMERFWKVLRPPHTEKLSVTINPEGVMGNDCYIDQPFQCEYGFNLKIGKNVTIGKNCLIEDVAEVVIGDGCRIGPNVTINTMEWSKNAQDRDEGLAIAKMVRLENGVVLGANVLVMPGTHIKSGSVVEPGTILKGEVS